MGEEDKSSDSDNEEASESDTEFAESDFIYTFQASDED